MGTKEGGTECVSKKKHLYTGGSYTSQTTHGTDSGEGAPAPQTGRGCASTSYGDGGQGVKQLLQEDGERIQQNDGEMEEEETSAGQEPYPPLTLICIIKRFIRNWER